MKKYSLTLTRPDRRAIDWIGDRFASGNDLYHALWAPCEQIPSDADWDDRRNIVFILTAKDAHRVTEIRDECEGGWPCFASELAEKLDDLCSDYERDFPNLDGMFSGDLEAYASDTSKPAKLREYALNKRVAMQARKKGEIPRALDYERTCEAIYNALPKWARW